MAVTTVDAIRVLVPLARWNVDYKVRNNVILSWTYKATPQPTAAELASVTQAQVNALNAQQQLSIKKMNPPMQLRGIGEELTNLLLAKGLIAISDFSPSTQQALSSRSSLWSSTTTTSASTYNTTSHE